MKTIIGLIKKLLRKTRKTPRVDAKYIIPQKNHHVSKTDIGINALKVLTRLNNAGYEAYLVGGSVRDLLLRKVPKDFDVTTNATPAQIKQLFRGSRIIGRRFKLVHIPFYREIIEVATFRGAEIIDEHKQVNVRGMLIRDNVYGTLEEDAWRRDLSINSLYYDIRDGSIIDFTGGVVDVRQKLIRVIGDPITRYTEDPVRMLRVIRFGAKLHFKLAEDSLSAIHNLHGLISHISNSRLFDEVVKLYQCGEAVAAHKMLIDTKLFMHLLPQTHKLLKSDYATVALIALALENTDTRIRENKPVTPAFLYAIFLWFPLQVQLAQLLDEEMDPVPALDKAMSMVIAAQNRITVIPRRYTEVMRDIWSLQYKLTKRTEHIAYNVLQHPRFRAAYDFLAIRALAEDADMDIAAWWTTFQEVNPTAQQKMIASLTANEMTSASKAKKRRKKKA